MKDNGALNHCPKVYLYRRIVQAKLFIDTHYSEPIDLSNIADEAYFSKFHFIRLFASIYGRTPHQYLKYVRIQNAKLLLKKGHIVSEACYAVGFESVSSFSGLFHKSEGISPSKYAFAYKESQSEKNQKPQAFVPSCYAEQHGWFENSNFEEV